MDRNALAADLGDRLQDRSRRSCPRRRSAAPPRRWAASPHSASTSFRPAADVRGRQRGVQLFRLLEPLEVIAQAVQPNLKLSAQAFEQAAVQRLDDLIAPAGRCPCVAMLRLSSTTTATIFCCGFRVATLSAGCQSSSRISATRPRLQQPDQDALRTAHGGRDRSSRGAAKWTSQNQRRRQAMQRPKPRPAKCQAAQWSLWRTRRTGT